MEQDKRVFEKEVRGVKYSLDVSTSIARIDDLSFNISNSDEFEKHKSEFYLIHDVLEMIEFSNFLEIGLKLKVNEENVGIEVLKEKYNQSYTSLKAEMMHQLNIYLAKKLNVCNRFNMIYLKDRFTSQEFEDLLAKLKADILAAVKKRTFETIPFIVEESLAMQYILDSDMLIGNLQIPCDKIKAITNIKWCAANCDKFKECSIYKEMKETNPFDWAINEEYLQG